MRDREKHQNEYQKYRDEQERRYWEDMERQQKAYKEKFG